MVQTGGVLGKNLFHCHFLLYQIHKNSTLTGRPLTAWTTGQLARNTLSSFSVLNRTAYLARIHVYGRHMGTSCAASVWFNLVRNNLKILHIRHIWNCVHKPWSCWWRQWTTRWKVAGSIPDWVTGIFYWFNPSGYITSPVSTQNLTDMSTRNISRGVKAAGA
jgi:hypothetical protein